MPRNAEKTDNEKNAFKVSLMRKIILELPRTEASPSWLKNRITINNIIIFGKHIDSRIF